MSTRNTLPSPTAHWQSTITLNLLLLCCCVLLFGLVSALSPCNDFLCITRVRNLYLAVMLYPFCGAVLNGFLFNKYRAGISIFIALLFALLFLTMLCYLFILVFS